MRKKISKMRKSEIRYKIRHFLFQKPWQELVLVTEKGLGRSDYSGSLDGRSEWESVHLEGGERGGGLCLFIHLLL